MSKTNFSKICLLLLFLCIVSSFTGTCKATVTVQTIGAWSVSSEPTGKSSFIETCFGIDPRLATLYYSLYWTDNGELMLVREYLTNTKTTSVIQWKTKVPAGLEGSVFLLRGFYPTCTYSSPMAIVAARSPYYWVILCQVSGCKIHSGPQRTHTTDKIERVRDSVFQWPKTLNEIDFITLKGVYQVEFKTGRLLREYHWNSTTFGNFQPTKFQDARVSKFSDIPHMKEVYQLSVIMSCRQLVSPFRNATCVVAMGANPNELDTATLFSPSASNFYFYNVTSSVSWSETVDGQGVVAVYKRGTEPELGFPFPFFPGEVWAGPSWRDERHPTSILASYVPGTSGFRLWFVSTIWWTSHPHVNQVLGPFPLTGSVPILPHPRGATQYVRPSTLALAYEPATATYHVNVYTVQNGLSNPPQNFTKTSPRFRFFSANCNPSTCDTESRGNCPKEDSCWGAGRSGTFVCCHGPPV